MIKIGIERYEELIVAECKYQQLMRLIEHERFLDCKEVLLLYGEEEQERKEEQEQIEKQEGEKRDENNT